jgi:hypothetical protein
MPAKVRFLAWVLQTLVHCFLTGMSACNISFVDLLMFHFDVFWGMCAEILCNVFLLLFMVFLVPIFATLCMKAVLMLWHAFLFLGCRPMGFFLLSPFLANKGPTVRMSPIVEGLHGRFGCLNNARAKVEGGRARSCSSPWV